MRKLLMVISLLICVSSAQAQYDVIIDNNPSATMGTIVDVSVSISPNSSSYALGGFDLSISFEGDKLTYITAVPGELLENCDWEYFTWRYNTDYAACCVNCPQVNIIELISIADVNNGTPHPTCNSALGLEEIATIKFYVPNDGSLEGYFSPIDFYWRTDVDPCTENVFSSEDGSSTYGANNVYKADGSTFDPAFNCSGPPASCGELVREFDFYGGGMTFHQADTSDRGDLNLNGIKYQISDAILYTNYFIYGPSVFTIDVVRQIAASEINCDGIALTVADLVYMIRIITGDAFPLPPCYESSPKNEGILSQAASSDADTMSFPGASGYPNQQRIPFELNVSNQYDLAGLQVRMEYNSYQVSPRFDPVIGDSLHVEYELVGRASDFENDGAVKVTSSEPGVIVIRFLPDLDGADYPIAAGSGTIIKVFMNVNPPPIMAVPTDVSFVTEDYDYNLFSDEYGYAVEPTLIDGQFIVTSPPPPPSCPVLYSYSKSQYVEENPLLTACEQYGYQQTVTDFYHVQATPDITNGIVTFQLREMEDEITYLEDISLITVDHSVNTNVACDIYGNIFTYQAGQGLPISAVDNNGVDRLSEVISEDGIWFVSDESGSLTLTFPNSGDMSGIGFHAAQKGICVMKPTPGDAENVATPDLTVELLDGNGNWVEFPRVPSRENGVEEIVIANSAEFLSTEFVTMKLSWEGGPYSTDVVRQYNPAGERPKIANWETNNLNVTGKVSPLVMRNGDIVEFSFNTGELGVQNLVRDYIIVATGRYEPDYSVFSHLLPNTVQLYDNYPNPFNPTTTISFSLPSASQVRLEIYNSLGQLVTTLVNEHKAAGHYQFEWKAIDNSGSGVASGIYFYRLVTDDFEDTKKMMILK